MKICWDNLEGVRLTKHGNFYHSNGNRLIYYDSCESCGEPYLAYKLPKHLTSKWCTNKCKRKPKIKCKQCNNLFQSNNKKKFFCSRECSFLNRKLNRKITLCKGCKKPFYGGITYCSYKCRPKPISYSHICQNPQCNKDFTSRSEDSIYCSKFCAGKITFGNYKKNKPKWTYDGSAGYDHYEPKISYAEDCRRDPMDKRLLQIRCAWCNKWYTPRANDVSTRLQCLNGTLGQSSGMDRSGSENRLYCSEDCKSLCPNYRVQPNQQMRKDSLLNGGIDHRELSRDVQPDLRKMVFARDDWKCVKCNSTENLHCHHIEGINWAPLESADMDMCITVCASCHLKIHQIPGCSYHDMRCDSFI